MSDSYCKGCRDNAAGCERCLPAREERERQSKRTAAESRVLDAARVWWDTRKTERLYNALQDLELLERTDQSPSARGELRTGDDAEREGKP